MNKLITFCFAICIASSVNAQRGFEKLLDSIQSENQAAEFINNNKSLRGKIIVFNKEKHNTRLANDLFKLRTGGKKVYRTDIDKTYYKVIEKIQIPHYRVSYIYIDGSDATLEEVSNLRREIIKKYKSGIRFEELAKQYSMDNSAKRGGDLGWFTKGDMVEEFESQIINGNHYVDDIFTVDVSSRQWYYVVLKTYNTKMIEEIKVLKVTQPVK